MSIPENTDGTRRGAFFARYGAKLAHALTSPSTILTASAALAATLAVGAPPLLVVAAALGAYSTKVAVSTSRGRDVTQILYPGAHVELDELEDPYRSWVESGLRFRQRFLCLLDSSPSAVQDSIRELTDDLDAAVSELVTDAEYAQELRATLDLAGTPALDQAHSDACAEVHEDLALLESLCSRLSLVIDGARKLAPSTTPGGDRLADRLDALAAAVGELNGDLETRPSGEASREAAATRSDRRAEQQSSH